MKLFSIKRRGPALDLLPYTFSHDHFYQPQLDYQSQLLPTEFNRYCRQMWQQQNISLLHEFYMHDEEKMSMKMLCNSERQRIQQAFMQLPVSLLSNHMLSQRYDKLLSQEVGSSVYIFSTLINYSYTCMLSLSKTRDSDMHGYTFILWSLLDHEKN